MREAEAVAFLTATLPPFLAEFRDRFPVEPVEEQAGFSVVNGVYMAVDRTSTTACSASSSPAA